MTDQGWTTHGGRQLGPADFDTSLLPARARWAHDSGQGALFTSGETSQATRPATAGAELPGQAPLFGDDPE